VAASTKLEDTLSRTHALHREKCIVQRWFASSQTLATTMKNRFVFEAMMHCNGLLRIAMENNTFLREFSFFLEILCKKICYSSTEVIGRANVMIFLLFWKTLFPFQ